jgi:GDPmannose 4,6-dehydratase
MNKTAIITGITGQDGSYLAENLLGRGYKVVGVKRRNSTANTGRLRNVLTHANFYLEEGDITDSSYVLSSLLTYKPTHIFNLAAQSHVATSFHQPMLTFDVTGKAVLNYLEAIKLLCQSTRFYQASSSEMFGSSVTRQNDEAFQNESTPFMPQSPYAVAKLSAHHLVRLYRESYGLFAVSGILFNHESERRGDLFVTKKITNYVRSLRDGTQKFYLELGNMDVFRDWGHAEDYVEAMRLMIEADEPDDFVVGTGETHSVREFAEISFSLIGKKSSDYIHINKELFRPSEVNFLRADARKIREKLGWQPKISFGDLIRRMLNDNTSGY